MAKERLNKLLCDRGFAASLDEANRKILAKEVKVNDSYLTTPSEMVPADARIEVKVTCAYVSRGGIKLKGAIDAFDVKVAGKNCIDIGSSTGGFSDCLLQEGAGRVACVDVNYGQLAWEVRQNERSAVFERTNIKKADPQELGAPFDLIVIDVSFIGLASLAPVLKRFAHEPAEEKTELVALVKPEFEASHEENVGGLVADDDVRERTVAEVKAALSEQGFTVQDVIESPIRGKKKGNKEFLLYAKY
ncbi:MAG: TlyA family RNA methyltransferase [Phoenicibacter congonensis]|uniref:TlyA family RNA methyltransferase n=1 Tax=Phoenicibacter congonensis TaxID=1944646 RepID=A0AA43RHZ3_9ACTN|nr:TlyA family RNA methyltransferase [Phoenicibacter congonensis]